MSKRTFNTSNDTTIVINDNKLTVSKFYGNKDLFKKSIPIFKSIRNNPHPNIVPILSIDEENFKITMPYYQYGDVHDELKIKNINKLNLIIDVCNGLIHLHKIGISHSDIKLDNIFVGDTKTYLIGDIECSNGTIPFMSPERYTNVIKKMPDIKSFEDDLWSLGMLIYSLYSNVIIFSRPSSSDKNYLLFKLKSSNIFKIGAPISNVSIKNLILKLLIVDPSKRISAENVLKFIESHLVK